MSPTLSEPTNSSNHASPMMPFGKHRGVPLAELDDAYLLWVGCLNDLRPPLLGHVLREMARRLADRPAAGGVQP